MIKTNESGEPVVYIMEPEEELYTLRFIEMHKPHVGLMITQTILWDPNLTMTEKVEVLGLRGGYGVHFHGLSRGDFA